MENKGPRAHDGTYQPGNIFTLLEDEEYAHNSKSMAFWKYIRHMSGEDHIFSDKDDIGIRVFFNGTIDMSTFSVQSQDDFRKRWEAWKDAEARFIFIKSQIGGRGLDITWPMFLDIAESLDAMPQTLMFAIPQPTIRAEISRDSSTGEFAARVSGDVSEFCISIYHCQSTFELAPENTAKVSAVKSSVRRTVFYNKIVNRPHKTPSVHWIIIGRPILATLQENFTYEADNSLDSEVLALSDLRNEWWNFVTYRLIAHVAKNGWQLMLDSIENYLESAQVEYVQDVFRDKPVNRDSDHVRLINTLYMIESRLNRAKMQIGCNISALQDLTEWQERRLQNVQFLRKDSSNITKDLNASLRVLRRRSFRVEYLTNEVQNAIQQASRLAAHLHSTKMETFSWHGLKLSYTVEAAIRQATVIFVLFIPGIFTSTFFSSNFFVITSLGNNFTFTTQNLWLWFAVTLPLAALVMVMVWLVRWRRSRTLHSESEKEPVVL